LTRAVLRPMFDRNNGEPAQAKTVIPTQFGVKGKPGNPWCCATPRCEKLAVWAVKYDGPELYGFPPDPMDRILADV